MFRNDFFFFLVLFFNTINILTNDHINDIKSSHEYVYHMINAQFK